MTEIEKMRRREHSGRPLSAQAQAALMLSQFYGLEDRRARTVQRIGVDRLVALDEMTRRVLLGVRW